MKRMRIGQVELLAVVAELIWTAALGIGTALPGSRTIALSVCVSSDVAIDTRNLFYLDYEAIC